MLGAGDMMISKTDYSPLPYWSLIFSKQLQDIVKGAKIGEV